MKSSKEKGITLIALIITIIVLLILAGIGIGMIMGEDGLLGKAEEAKFKNNMGEYREKVNLYVSWRIMEDMTTDTYPINSGEPLKNAIEQGIILDIEENDVTISINDIIENIKKEAKDYVVVYKGEICYASNPKIPNNKKQEQWCKELGIKILEMEELESIEIRNGDYELVNGVYLCTPKLDERLYSRKN